MRLSLEMPLKRFMSLSLATVHFYGNETFILMMKRLEVQLLPFLQDDVVDVLHEDFLVDIVVVAYLLDDLLISMRARALC